MLAGKSVYKGGAIALSKDMQDTGLVQVKQISNILNFVQARRVSLGEGRGRKE